MIILFWRFWNSIIKESMWIIPKWLELNQFLLSKKQASLRKQPTFYNTNTDFAPKKISGEQVLKFHIDDTSLLRFG